MARKDWLETNRALWDERVAVHLAPGGYDLEALRQGRARLNAIEERELGPVKGLRVLHLQCHFGRDSLILAQRGADVVGLDFSAPAVEAANKLAAEMKLPARFVQADLYDAPRAIVEPAEFDLVFTTWGTIGWLPDIQRWAGVVAHFLKPGGVLYLADGHPAALVLDDSTAFPDGRPGFYAPYFEREAIVSQSTADYKNEKAVLKHTTEYSWMHPLGETITALIDAGMRLDWLHEHPTVTTRMFKSLVKVADGTYGWPDKPWLPLAFSLKATRT